MNLHLFLCHCPFKGLSKYVKKWLLTPRGHIPQGDWLSRVAYPRETDSPGYATLMSLTRWGMQPRGDFVEKFVPWLPGVWDPGEIDSPAYQTPGSQSRRGMRPRGVNLPGVCDPGESCFGGFFIDSPGYDTPGRFIKTRISRRKRN